LRLSWQALEQVQAWLRLEQVLEQPEEPELSLRGQWPWALMPQLLWLEPGELVSWPELWQEALAF